jgi:hypothetical protein
VGDSVTLQRRLRAVVGTLALAAIVFHAMAVVVREGEAVLVTRFGRPLRAATQTGLHWKLPWPIDEASVLDMRRRVYETGHTEMLTRDKKNVVAGPAAVVAAMTVATRLRILIKSVDFLERASDVDTLILDKTGTVTVGAPTVTQIRPVEGESETTLLAVAAACGFGSLHPVSRAVVAEALSRGIVSAPPRDLQERPGLGVVATVDGQQAILGRRALLMELGVNVGSDDDEDVSQVWVAHGGRCLGRRAYRHDGW